jgi:carbamoyltransferase
MQGRSEFGPRALGNRSILADPRPVGNRARINDIIKKREAFRPFAPAILEEDVLDYFDVPTGRGSFAFMSFVVRVRQDKRALLGAVTHIDGSARLQTVSQAANPRFWLLLQRFKERTGIPCLLNTSFNNNAEPIVESVADGIVTCLTTELDYLVVNDYLVTKRRVDWTSLAGLQITLPHHVQLVEHRGFNSLGEATIACTLRSTHDEHFQLPVSHELHQMLAAAHDAPASALTLMDRAPSSGTRTLVQDLLQLWQQRLIALHPSPIGTSAPPRAVTV